MRRSSFDGQDLPFVPFSEELFVNAVEIAGIRVAPLADGRYVATWTDDESGRPRMSIGGKYISFAIQYRHVTGETTK